MNFPVTAAKEAALRGRMARLGIGEEDLEEGFICGGGPGGQKANKTSSTVVLRHRGTGVEVRCMRERSQGMNRFFARRLLCEKVEALRLREEMAVAGERERERRRKRKRSAGQRAVMVEGKRRHAAKKALRREPGLDE